MLSKVRSRRSNFIPENQNGYNSIRSLCWLGFPFRHVSRNGAPYANSLDVCRRQAVFWCVAKTQSLLSWLFEGGILCVEN